MPATWLGLFNVAAGVVQRDPIPSTPTAQQPPQPQPIAANTTPDVRTMHPIGGRNKHEQTAAAPDGGETNRSKKGKRKGEETHQRLSKESLT